MTKRELVPQACDGCSSILVVTVAEMAQTEDFTLDDAGGTLRIRCPECGGATDIACWGTADPQPEVRALVSLLQVEARSRKRYSDLLLEALPLEFDAWRICILRSHPGGGVSFEIEYWDGRRSGPDEITEEDLNGPLGLAPRLRLMEEDLQGKGSVGHL